VIASFAFITSFLFSFWCQSIQFVPEGGSDVAGGDSSIRFGPWYRLETVTTSQQVGQYTRVATVDTCVQYPAGTSVDPALKAVRAFRYVPCNPSVFIWTSGVVRVQRMTC